MCTLEGDERAREWQAECRRKRERDRRRMEEFERGRRAREMEEAEEHESGGNLGADADEGRVSS